MKKPTSFTLALFAAISLSVCSPAAADDITFFGDFVDGFGTGLDYDSTDPDMPGSFALLFSEMVVGIPKFDPGLGTLTDITVFVDPGDPIMYDIGGGMGATEIDPLIPTGFSADVFVGGDVGINYEDPALALHSVVTDPVELSGFCGGSMGDGGCGDGLFPIHDGMLDGSSSVFGLVDPSDFVGPGLVDSLFVQLFMPETADYFLDNADATADTFFDVFAGFSAPPVDDIVGVTYTFTPIPEPGSLLLAVTGLALLAGMRRRK